MILPNLNKILDQAVLSAPMDQVNHDLLIRRGEKTKREYEALLAFGMNHTGMQHQQQSSPPKRELGTG